MLEVISLIIFDKILAMKFYFLKIDFLPVQKKSFLTSWLSTSAPLQI